MSQVVHVERVFTTRAQAEAWFDHLKPSAWPYVWCMQDARDGRWRVTALLETAERRKVS